MPKEWYGTSLVTQWVGICLPMQGNTSSVLGSGLQAATSSKHTETTEARVPRACVSNERNHRSEKPQLCNEERLPLSATRESLCKAIEIQHSQKLK